MDLVNSVASDWDGSTGQCTWSLNVRPHGVGAYVQPLMLVLYAAGGSLTAREATNRVGKVMDRVLTGFDRLPVKEKVRPYPVWYVRVHSARYRLKMLFMIDHTAPHNIWRRSEYGMKEAEKVFGKQSRELQ